MRAISLPTDKRRAGSTARSTHQRNAKPAADLAPSTASIESSRKGVRASLTPRQLQVLALLGEGLSNKLICRRLKIAHGTVKVHIAGILRELGVSNRVQAVMTARRGGLLSELS
jgi:DNA-binding NarL/FixJ family response regulator